MSTPDQPPTEGITRRLVQAAQASDSKAFDTLYERMKPRLLAWIQFQLSDSVGRRTPAAEVMQEVWSRAWSQFAAFDPEKVPFRRWLFRIAKNVVLETYRQARRHGNVCLENGNSQPIDARLSLATESTVQLQRLANDETSRLVAAFAATLNDCDRQIFVLCGLEGASRSEVAKRVNLKVEAVTKRWQRMCVTLRNSPLARILEDE